MSTSEAYNILIWMALGSKSHFNPIKPLAMELADRGHHLTFVSPVHDKDLENHPGNVNFHPIILQHGRAEDMMDSKELFAGNTRIGGFAEVLKLTKNTSDLILQSPFWKEIKAIFY